MPKDPRQLMIFAANLNGLSSPAVGPWHLKVTYSTFDSNGNPGNKGTYEEYWVSPTRFKRITVQGDSTLTEFGTDGGIMRAGAIKPAPWNADEMRQLLAVPFPPIPIIEREEIGKEARKVNGEKLLCLDVANRSTSQVYCLNQNQPALRIYSVGSLEVDYSRILSFQQHYVAGDITIYQNGKQVVTAHVDSIDSLTPIDPAIFVPSADAVPFHRRINVSAGVAVGMLQNHPAPLYPADAKAAGISGTVVLQATIGVDGRISDLSVVQGPQELRQAALDAVRTWSYRPYLLNNEPVEVHTVINVVFSLDRR